jgi:uncharacterized protein YqgV (UPF0045/DUF77 family)
MGWVIKGEWEGVMREVPVLEECLTEVSISKTETYFTVSDFRKKMQEILDM